MVALRTENLTKVFGKRAASGVRAVDGLSLEVQKGRAFAFLGPNGAGKTTTIHMLLGLRLPSCGRGEVLGEPLGSVRAKAKIGFLPEGMSPKGYYTTEQMLAYCARLHGLRDREASARIDSVISVAGLEEVRRRRTSHLSKGMVQRLGLAQGLIGDPELLILDEPTANLDPIGRRDVRRLLLDMKKEGKTIFVSSHILSEVESVCDDVAILIRGRLVRQGPLSELAGRMEGFEIAARALPETTAHAITRAGGRIETATEDGVVICVPDEATQQRVLAVLVGADIPILYANKRAATLEELFFQALGEEQGK